MLKEIVEAVGTTGTNECDVRFVLDQFKVPPEKEKEIAEKALKRFYSLAKKLKIKIKDGYITHNWYHPEPYFVVEMNSTELYNLLKDMKIPPIFKKFEYAWIMGGDNKLDKSYDLWVNY